MVEINAYSKAKDGGKKLSANFTVKEFACKDGSDAVLTAPRVCPKFCVNTEMQCK